jgi:ribosomal protein S18 acetylase RimI-like enzyme
VAGGYVSITVERTLSATPELVARLNELLPQLSATAAPLTLGELEAIVSSDVTVLFVARDDGVAVGTLTLVELSTPTGARAWIEDVVVDEGARGKGAGEALALAAIAEARRRGVKSIDLTTRPSREAANALYRKLGFERRDTNVYRFFLGN